MEVHATLFGSIVISPNNVTGSYVLQGPMYYFKHFIEGQLVLDILTMIILYSCK